MILGIFSIVQILKKKIEKNIKSFWQHNNCNKNKMTDKDIKKILYNQSQLDKISTKLAKRIDQDYRGKELTLIGILKGAYVFLSDLSRKITIPHTIEFMSVSSYSDTKSTGTVKLLTDLRCSVKDRHIIIVEDILDSGLTLNYLIELLHARHPLSIECCVLLSKPSAIKKPVNVKYLGFELDPPEFVIGYGLDYNELFRNLPYIGVPTKEAIEKYAEK